MQDAGCRMQEVGGQHIVIIIITIIITMSIIITIITIIIIVITIIKQEAITRKHEAGVKQLQH